MSKPLHDNQTGVNSQLLFISYFPSIEHFLPLVSDAEESGYRVVPALPLKLVQDLVSPLASDPQRMLFAIDDTDECLSNNPRLSRVLMVVATLVNSVTCPHVPGVPVPIAEDDDDLDQVS